MRINTNQLILYRPTNEHTLFNKMAYLINNYDNVTLDIHELVSVSYESMNLLINISKEYNFENNLWKSYLVYYLATNENPFSITCEKFGKKEGSINELAIHDFSIWLQLYHYDFRELERFLNIHCFSSITEYEAVEKSVKVYNKNVSDKIKQLNSQLYFAETPQFVLNIITSFYNDYGVGIWGLNKAFRLKNHGDDLEILPIHNTDDIYLSDLVGYEIQKSKLIANTESFINGNRANNCLLFGDSGTGKSSSIKAILNAYYDKGLRMIEIYKHQFKDLLTLIDKIKDRNYKFIIYMDDLSFEENESEYKYLKAVIEGGLESKPDNVLIYATSNRRHLIKESWSDRAIRTEDIHISDTTQEKLSLVNRFGISILYTAPTPKEYLNITKILAQRYNISIDEDVLQKEAMKWEMYHGGLSGRTSQQFINHLIGELGQI